MLVGALTAYLNAEAHESEQDWDGSEVARALVSLVGPVSADLDPGIDSSNGWPIELGVSKPELDDTREIKSFLDFSEEAAGDEALQRQLHGTHLQQTLKMNDALVLLREATMHSGPNAFREVMQAGARRGNGFFGGGAAAAFPVETTDSSSASQLASGEVVTYRGQMQEVLTICILVG